MTRTLLKSVLIILLLSNCNLKEKETRVSNKEKEANTTLTVGNKHTISSKILEEERPIIISLPDGYEDSDSNYPVLYLTDGLQNIWHVVGAAEVLTRTGGMPPIIIVGIESTNRSRDFTPTVDENRSESGGGPKFLSFIEKEVIPYIESNYRTHPFRVLEGHSMGGLFTASALIQKPNLFNAHIIISPSLWWNNHEIIEFAGAFFKEQFNLDKSVFFGIGKLESDTEWGMRKELQNFMDVLKKNQPKKLRFKHQEFDNEGHMSSPLLSNYNGLKFIFSDIVYPDSSIVAYNDEKFLQHESKIMSKYGVEAKQSAEAYVRIASYLMEKENISGAITVMNRCSNAYPFDVGLMNFLASLYEKNEEIDKAIEMYNKAIEVSEKYNYNREDEFIAKIEKLNSQKN